MRLSFGSSFGSFRRVVWPVTPCRPAACPRASAMSFSGSHMETTRDFEAARRALSADCFSRFSSPPCAASARSLSSRARFLCHHAASSASVRNAGMTRFYQYPTDQCRARDLVALLSGFRLIVQIQRIAGNEFLKFFRDYPMALSRIIRLRESLQLRNTPQSRGR